ncbi:MAG: hypothetical protein B7Z25_04430 [Aerococcus viridans]|nr:MAG: hypothetical protein B7Z25_04430 [Aerococcus viridans]
MPLLERQGAQNDFEKPLFRRVNPLRGKRKLTAKVKKGSIHRALIIRTKSCYTAFNGESVSFRENSAILLISTNKTLFPSIISVCVSVAAKKRQPLSLGIKLFSRNAHNKGCLPSKSAAEAKQLPPFEINSLVIFVLRLFIFL